MPVPTTIADLSTTAASNYPQGTDSPSTLDDVQRAHGSFIAQLATGVTNHAATSKATPVDADELPINDSASSFTLAKLTWANLKSAIKTYLSGVAFPIGSTTPSTGAFTTLSASGTIKAKLGDANEGSLDGAQLYPSSAARTGFAGIFGDTLATSGVSAYGNAHAKANTVELIANSAVRATVSTTGLSVIGALSSTGATSANNLLITGTTGATIGFGDTSAAIQVFNGSAGSPNHIDFYTGTYKQVTLDAVGNWGLGVVPSAWSGIGKTLQINTGAAISADAANMYQSNNAYYNGSNWIYTTSNYATRYTAGTGSHTWYTAPSGTAGNPITFTQAMTLDANGNWLLGTTNVSVPTNGFSFQPNGAASGASQMLVGHASGSASGLGYYWCLYNGANIGSITQNGTTAVAYNTTSDHRLKTNVRPANAARFMDIQFRDFEWVDGRHDCGVIAHELQAVYPDLVFGEKDATEVRQVEITPAVPAVLDAEGNEVTPAIPAVTEEQTFPVYQQVNYTGLIGRMGTVIQQQAKLIAALDARLTALEAK